MHTLMVSETLKVCIHRLSTTKRLARAAQVGFHHTRVLAQIAGVALQRNRARLQDIAAIGHLQRHKGVLFNQKNACAFTTKRLLDDEGENDQNGEDAHSHDGDAPEIGIDVVIVLSPNRLTSRRGASRSGAPAATAGSRTWALCLLANN